MSVKVLSLHIVYKLCTSGVTPQLQRCSPASASDLVVQKKKVEQIRSWLQAESGTVLSLLFLSGMVCREVSGTVVLLADAVLTNMNVESGQATEHRNHLCLQV